jgi:hypothetical protein
MSDQVALMFALWCPGENRGYSAQGGMYHPDLQQAVIYKNRKTVEKAKTHHDTYYGHDGPAEIRLVQLTVVPVS